MNVVVFAPYAINTPHFETDLDIVHDHCDRGDDVTLLLCGGELEACDPNPQHDLSRCAKCMARRDTGSNLLPSRIRFEPLLCLTDQEATERDALRTDFADIKELKEFRIQGFDIGYGVVSSLVSMTRDPDVDLHQHRQLLRALMRSAWTVYRSIQRYLATRDVDRVYVYNGRFAVLRAVLRACQEAGVECYTHERGHAPPYYTLCKNTTPHDIQYMNAQIWEAWWSAGEASDREQIARRWYQQRAAGQNDLCFVRGQQDRLLPAKWNPQQRNIGVFVSSEDEFVGIGASWKNPLYETQLAGIQSIVDSLANDPRGIHLYLRVHPNLADVDNSQTRAIDDLNSPHLTVIPAESPVSSYTLLRACEKVVTFGSTVGIEAVYWGKPSILAGMSFYRDFGAAHNPDSHEHLMSLLVSNDLEAKPIEPALVYAFYWATFGQPFKYFVSDGWHAGRFKGQRIAPALKDNVRIAWLNAAHPQRILRRARKAATRCYQHVRKRLRAAAEKCA